MEGMEGGSEGGREGPCTGVFSAKRPSRARGCPAAGACKACVEGMDGRVRYAWGWCAENREG